MKIKQGFSYIQVVGYGVELNYIFQRGGSTNLLLEPPALRSPKIRLLIKIKERVWDFINMKVHEIVCLVWLVILCLDSANVKLLDLDKMEGEEIRRKKHN